MQILKSHFFAAIFSTSNHLNPRVDWDLIKIKVVTSLLFISVLKTDLANLLCMVLSKRCPTSRHTLREEIFAGINFRELGFTEDFAGINFRKLSLTKDFAGINFRECALYKDFVGVNFAFSLKNTFSTILVYGFESILSKE